jgi:hypothetical protein
MPKHPSPHASNSAAPAALTYRDELRRLRSLTSDEFASFDPSSQGVSIPVRVVSGTGPCAELAVPARSDPAYGLMTVEAQP